MGRTSQQIFSPTARETVPAHLCEQICSTIARERIRRERMRLAVSSLFGTSSLAGLVFALPALMSAASASGFVSYSQLLLTDTDFAATNIRAFIIPVLEALPGVEVMITLFLIAVFLVSLRNFARSLYYKPLAFQHS